MLSVQRISSIGGIVLALAVADACAAVQGHVEVKQQSWNVADAIAYRSGDELKVVLSDKPFDRAAFAKDGKLDDFDFINHHMQKEASTFTLQFGTDLKLQMLNTGGGATNAGIDKAFTPSAKHSATELAGTFVYNGDLFGKVAVNVTFDLPVESDKLQRPGKPLAADAGDPGKALLRNVAAIHSGKLEQIIAVSPPERREQMEKSKGEAKEMLPMMQSMTPKDVKPLGGMIDGDSAQVDFQGVLDGKPQKGTAELTRIGGAWYVTGMNLDAN